MRKQIVYLFIHPTNGTGASLALGLMQSDHGQSDEWLLDAFQPYKLRGDWRKEYDSIMAEGYAFSNWHVTSCGAGPDWPAVRKFYFAVV